MRVTGEKNTILSLVSLGTRQQFGISVWVILRLEKTHLSKKKKKG